MKNFYETFVANKFDLNWEGITNQVMTTYCTQSIIKYSYICIRFLLFIAYDIIVIIKVHDSVYFKDYR